MKLIVRQTSRLFELLVLVAVYSATLARARAEEDVRLLLAHGQKVAAIFAGKKTTPSFRDLGIAAREQILLSNTNQLKIITRGGLLKWPL